MFRNKLLLSLTFFMMSAFFYTHTADAATYIAKKGEQLDEIAEEYNISVYTLLELNGLDDEEEIYEGFVLIVPDEKTAPAAIIETAPAQVKAVHDSKKEMIEDYEVAKTLTVEASAFTAYCKGCSGKTAYGIDLKKNPDIKLIAVDPKVIPLGTKVWVDGYGIAIAGDTGGSIKGNRIDVFMKTKKSAYSWGRKKVEIKILK